MHLCSNILLLSPRSDTETALRQHHFCLHTYIVIGRRHLARLLLVANMKVDWTRLGLGFRKLLFARKFKLTADLGGPRLIMLISQHRIK